MNSHVFKLHNDFKNEEFRTLDLIMCHENIDVIQSTLLFTLEDKKHSVLEINLKVIKNSNVTITLATFRQY